MEIGKTNATLMRRKTDAVALGIALGIALVAAMFIFYYTDMTDTLENSALMLESIVKGEFSQFYTYSLEHAEAVFAANYELPIYFIFLVWNLPAAIAYVNGAPSLDNPWAILWCKALILVALLVCAWLIYKIYQTVREEEDSTPVSRWVILGALLSSPTVFLSAFMACQYDCIMLAFVLAGLYFCIKGCFGQFLLMFCLAFPLKSFSIFIFMPLLLMREKRVWYIGLCTVLQLMITLVLGVLYRGDPAHGFLLGSQNRDAMNMITGTWVSLGDSGIRPFLAGFILVCIATYVRPYDKHFALYYPAVVMVMTLVLLPIRSYWMILAEPFLLLLILDRRGEMWVNMLLHTIGSVAGAVWHMYNHWIYNTGVNTKMLTMLKWVERPEHLMYGRFNQMINTLGLADYMPLVQTVYIACFAALLVINHPRFPEVKSKCHFSVRASLRTRIAALIAMTAVMVAVELIPGKVPFVNTLLSSGDFAQAESLRFGEDLSMGTIVEQAFTVVEGQEATQLALQFYLTDNGRNNRGRFQVRITQADDSTVLFERVMGNSSVNKNENYLIKLPRIPLEAGVEYHLTVQGIVTPKSGDLYCCHTVEKSQVLPPATVNGEAQEFSLCFQMQ